ncbi:M20 metallopeptidase family protein [Micropruina glycogenica]|uniref:Hippurate hydrolase n=1 Tax=Micropruina glycogenica TaxID=75385 RepID=A0A2N9JNC8_9ACTN|nr:M20 family metallopeptidase [Micropruina glycogenica]SPD88889.1 Hippurate hydrolase [Micropruina glycogenica]
MTSTTDIAARLHPELQALRRELHADPELGNDNPRTQARILAALDGLDLEITTGESVTSVVAVLRGRAETAGERPIVLLRGDMDGLPVTEATGQPFASTTGTMHACGHDLHVAGLVGAVRILHELRDELPGDVVFMFQPGEEGPGGAAPMIAEGVLDAAGRRADAAFGLHVISAQAPLGVWTGRAGVLMAAADQCYIAVRGVGGHGSQPHRSKDPVPVACEIVLALQAMVTRQFDAFDPVVVTAGRIVGGTKENIIPDDAHIDLTVRTFSKTNHDQVPERIERLARGIAEAHGLSAEVNYVPGYPVTVNDDAAYALMTDTVTDLFGAERYVEMPFPEAGAEDFSYVLEQVPGAYIFVSAYPGDDWNTTATNHSPRALFDDVVLADCSALLAEVTLRRLRQG